MIKIAENKAMRRISLLKLIYEFKKPQNQKGGWCVFVCVNSLIRNSFKSTFALQIRKINQRTSSYLLPLAVISSFSQLNFRA